MLITGGEHEDRVKHATQIAERLLCLNLTMADACTMCSNCTRVFHHTHPNLIFIEPPKDDGTIKIDQIRDVVRASNKTNFEPGVSVFVISHMHQATKSAANALLKVMEESRRDKVFIALAPSRTSVLPTIASRLVTHQVLPDLANFGAMNADVRQKIFAISEATLASRFSYCERMSVDREALMLELHEFIHECHVMLRTKKATPLFILKLREALERASANLRQNLNPRLVTERLILREWPTFRT